MGLLSGIFGTKVVPVKVDQDGTVFVSVGGSSVAVPVDIQYSAVKVSPVVVVNAQGIRDTVRHYSGIVKDWSQWAKQVWRIDNTHDQPIDILLNIENIGDYLKADGSILKFTAPANKTIVLVTPTEFAPLGVTFPESIVIVTQAAVAPTTGGITVTSYPVPIV